MEEDAAAFAAETEAAMLTEFCEITEERLDIDADAATFADETEAAMAAEF